MQIEVKRLAGLDGESVKMAGAEDEWAGRIRQSARSGFGDRCESPLVNRGNAFEHRAKRTAQNVGGFTRREVKRFGGDEFEAQREKCETHLSRHYTEQLEIGWINPPKSMNYRDRSGRSPEPAWTSARPGPSRKLYRPD